MSTKIPICHGSWGDVQYHLYSEIFDDANVHLRLSGPIEFTTAHDAANGCIVVVIPNRVALELGLRLQPDRPDDTIVDRLKIYEELSVLSSLAVHPDMPGYSTGRLLRDARDAITEMRNLRHQIDDLTTEIDALRARKRSA